MSRRILCALAPHFALASMAWAGNDLARIGSTPNFCADLYAAAATGQSISLPGGGKLFQVNPDSLSTYFDARRREESDFSLLVDGDQVVGQNMLANLPADSQLLHATEEGLTPAGRDPEKWLQPRSQSFSGGGNARREFMDDIHADLARLNTLDPKWRQVRRSTQDLLNGDPALPLTQELYRSFVGQHIAGVNMRVDEAGGKTVSLFEGRVRKVYSLNASDDFGPTHRVYAEIVQKDGSLATVALNNLESNPRRALHVLDYKEPPMTVAHTSEQNSLRRASSREIQARLRETPIFKGAQPRSASALLGSEGYEQLLREGNTMLERADLRSIDDSSTPLVLSGGRMITAHPLKKDHFFKLQRGDLVWDLPTMTPYRVGIDKIPDDVIYAFQGARGPTDPEDLRLAVVRAIDR